MLPDYNITHKYLYKNCNNEIKLVQETRNTHKTH